MNHGRCDNLYHRRRGSVRFGTLVLLVGVVIAAILGLIVWSDSGISRGGKAAEAGQPAILLKAELRSWVVAGRGRHLYLAIEAPEEYPELKPRIEFTAAFLREDYDPALDPTQAARLCRMTPGRALGPPVFSEPPDNRLEAMYTITLEQARELQRDRVFSVPYVLLGSNSTSGLRRVMEDVQLALPPQVLRGAGLLGEFPGIDRSAGAELAPEEWNQFGFVLPVRK